MKHAFLHKSCLIILLVALLAPVVLPYLDRTPDGMEQIDLTEKEGKEAHKKELEEKKFIFQDLVSDPSWALVVNSLQYKHKALACQQIHHEIVLPPPES